MQLFLGIVKYLSRFSPEIANLTGSLRPLAKKGHVYKIEKHHGIAFMAIIKELSNDRILKYFDLARKLFLECDGSGVGARFTLLQNFSIDLEQDTDESFLTAEYLANLLPIAYGSPTFTECERRYAYIERELLAVVCGTEKFNYYMFGRNTIILMTISHCPVSFSKT